MSVERSGVAGLTLGLVLGALGVLGYGLLFADEGVRVSGEARGSGRVESSVDPVELAVALRELRAVLSAIDSRLQRAEAGVLQGGRTPVSAQGGAGGPGAPSSSEAALADALAEIARALSGLRARGGGLALDSGQGPVLVVPGWVDRRAAFDSQALREAALSEDGPAFEASLSDYEREHLLLSYQQVVSTYGKPDGVRGTDKGMVWTYMLDVPGQGREEFTFYFQDGFVWRPHYHYDAE